MARFSYRARSRSGEEVKGVLEARDRTLAARELRSRLLLVLSLNAEGDQTERGDEELINNHFNWRSRLPVMAKDRVFFCRQLAMMISSGMTLVNALSLMKLEFPKLKIRQVLNTVLNDLQNGDPFSVCLGRHEKIFSKILVKVIESAEESGELAVSLRKVADHFEFWSAIRKKVTSACAYPGVIFLAAMGIGGFMVFKIIPKFDDFLSKRGVPLPWSTELVIGISRFGKSYWWLLVILFFLGIIGLVLTFKNEKGRRFLERVCLKLPLLGNVLLYASMSNFASTGSLLIKSGLSVVDTLKLLAGLMNMKIYKDVLITSANKVVMGSSLKESIKSPHIPPIVNNIIAVGEETGALNDVMEELGEFYNRELQGSIGILTTMIEPLLLIIVGGIVALVYFSLFQAIITLISS
jgi:type IV pilus assembly protein PilC